MVGFGNDGLSYWRSDDGIGGSGGNKDGLLDSQCAEKAKKEDLFHELYIIHRFGCLTYSVNSLPIKNHYIFLAVSLSILLIFQRKDGSDYQKGAEIGSLILLKYMSFLSAFFLCV